MIIEAILKINPNADVVIRGSDINTCEIEWLNGTTPYYKTQTFMECQITQCHLRWRLIDKL